MQIRCIKGFFCDGGSQAIMRGEMFFQLEGTENEFVGYSTHSRFPGSGPITFTEKQLCDYFEIVFI